MNVQKKSSLSRMKRKEEVAAYLFISPYLVSTLVFLVGLLIFAFYISLNEWNIFAPPEFIGLKNYIKTFRSEDFGRGLLNIFWYAVIVVFFQTSIALFLAVILNAFTSNWVSSIG